jgi:hypothetical protein
VNPTATSKLQFAVGTANIGGTATGLNTIVTFRQPNGLSATLVNSPTIVGPAGFRVPTAASAGTDAGTNHISSSPQTPANQPNPPATTFGQSGGAFGYGFMNANSSTGGSTNVSPSFMFSLPIYAATSAQFKYVGGPPAFPNVRTGTYPAGFAGYTEGFVDFQLTPGGGALATGTYTLNVVVPTSAYTNDTVTATANLSSLALLPTFAPPVLTPDGTGGGTVTLTVPPGVTEAYVNVVNLTGKCYASSATGNATTVYYTLRTTTIGTQTLTLPNNLGPTTQSGATTHTLCTSAESAAFNANFGTTGGDNYRVYAVGFDYPAYAAAYPFNTSQTPVITGAGGQSDVTTSAPTTGKYP